MPPKFQNPLINQYNNHINNHKYYIPAPTMPKQQPEQPPVPTEMQSEASVSSSQSQYSSEDEDGVLLTNKVQQKLLTVVARLKARDPAIYAIDKPIFEDGDFEGGEQGTSTKGKNGKKDRVTYKDLVTKKDRGESEEESEKGDNQKQLNLDDIKASFKNKLSKGSKTGQQKQQENDEELFKVKKRVEAPKKTTEDKLQQFVSNFSGQSSTLLSKLWKNEKKLDSTDLFLRNYIINEKWKTSRFRQQQLKINKEQNQEMIDEEDQKRSVEMDQYEAKYNFRFQEPGAEIITQYPRQIPESMRQKSESRKQKRKKLAERKKQEQEKLRKQAEQKKVQKKQQILAKITQTQQPEKQQSSDFQHDWFFCDDCTKPLEQNQQYFVCNECQQYMLCQQCYDLIIHKHQMSKAVIPIGAGPPQTDKAVKALTKLKDCKTCRKKIPPHMSYYQYFESRTHSTINMCEKCYDEAGLDIKKKYKKVEPANSYVNYEQLLDKNPEKIKQLVTQKDIDELVDEYIKCDFEDVIGGGLKTKFKYISVKPESYGLSDEQILYGDDKQLNKYVSIKKLGAYDDEEIKLRNNTFNRKIKQINKSASDNKKLVRKLGNNIRAIRLLKKNKTRAELLRKRRENSGKKLKIVNISNPDAEKNYYLPKSRLESYGITTGEPATQQNNQSE